MVVANLAEGSGPRLILGKKGQNSRKEEKPEGLVTTPPSTSPINSRPGPPTKWELESNVNIIRHVKRLSSYEVLYLANWLKELTRKKKMNNKTEN